jgi:hypothetical protein
VYIDHYCIKSPLKLKNGHGLWTKNQIKSKTIKCFMNWNKLILNHQNFFNFL